MDSKIKCLIKQSGGKFFYGEWFVDNSIAFHENELEEFIKLIIEECADEFPEKSDLEYACKHRFGLNRDYWIK